MRLCKYCGVLKPSTDFRRGRARCRPCLAKQLRDWCERNPQAARLIKKRSRAKAYASGKAKRAPAHKRRCPSLVWWAIQRGELVRPKICPRCFRDDSPIHAHHADYSKPLDVEWLCARCHQRQHHGIAA